MVNIFGNTHTELSDAKAHVVNKILIFSPSKMVLTFLWNNGRNQKIIHGWKMNGSKDILIKIYFATDIISDPLIKMILLRQINCSHFRMS